MCKFRAECSREGMCQWSCKWGIEAVARPCGSRYRVTDSEDMHRPLHSVVRLGRPARVPIGTESQLLIVRHDHVAHASEACRVVTRFARRGVAGAETSLGAAGRSARATSSSLAPGATSYPPPGL